MHRMNMLLWFVLNLDRFPQSSMAETVQLIEGFGKMAFLI